VRALAAGLSHFVVEHPKTARAFLKAVGTLTPLPQLHLAELNEHTRPEALESLLAPLLAGHDVGLLSEAGCPAIADPGASLVRLAHQRGIRVVPLAGPSAIVLALMASGLTGQRFAFHGYLPVEIEARCKALKDMEAASLSRDETQIFIETPYRNARLLEAILACCRDDTELSLAVDLTGPQEYVATRRVVEWKRQRPELPRKPVVFLLHAGRVRPPGKKGSSSRARR
jgi:16S rRNA (cytidine1402-2'-O)-methyltransferase